METNSRARKRSRLEQLSDREKVAELYVQGTPIFRIAETLGRTKHQVDYDIQMMQEDWRKSATETIDTHRQLQLRKLNRIESQMWEAWEKSKTTRKRTKKRFKAGKTESEPSSITVEGGEQVEEQTSGDARYVAIIMDCVKERSRLLGLYEATKIDAEITGAGGEPLNGSRLELSEAQLLEIVRLSYGQQPQPDAAQPAHNGADGGAASEAREDRPGEAADVHQAV